MAEDYKRPGWYPAPDGTPGERWWNGADWSESRRGGVATPGVAAPVTMPPAPPAGSSAPPRPNPYAPVPTAPAQFGPAQPGTAPAYNGRNNPLATVALVVGAVSAFGFGILGPVAIILSVVGIAKARQLKAQGEPSSSIVLAIIGLGLGAVGTLQLVVFFAVFIEGLSNP